VSRVHILFIGEPAWARLLADDLNARYPALVRCTYQPAITLREKLARVLLLLRCDVVVRVAGPPRLRWRLARVWMMLHRLRPELTTFIYWIGTDVMRACARVAGEVPPTRTLLADLAAVRACRNIAGAHHLTTELAEIGIKAETVPFPGFSLEPPAETNPMPAAMTVLSYVPDGRRDFYCLPALFSAARALPDVRFRIAGGHKTNLVDIPANVEFLGYVKDMSFAYADASVVVRLVEHDAVGATVAEGLLAGRPVIYSRPLPHTIHVPYADGEALVAALRDLRAQHASGGIPLNLAGREWAVREFDQDRRLARLLEVLLGLEPGGAESVQPAPEG